jgi:hypothetical protein
MFQLLMTINPAIMAQIVDTLNKEIEPLLKADVSNYAKGRMRVWLEAEAPLSATRPWVAGVHHERLWDYLTRITAPFGFTPDLALVSKGGSITEHRDASYAQYRSLGLNLGVATFHYRQVYPGMAWSKDQNQNATEEVYSLTGGELFEFNCKNPHAVSHVDAERWSINMWEVSNKEIARFNAFKEAK